MAIAALKVRWHQTPDSSNVAAIGRDSKKHVFVEFRSGDIYMYENVSYQRWTALRRAKSVGGYINRSIIPNYVATKVT
jgi:hypothetical protein